MSRSPRPASGIIPEAESSGKTASSPRTRLVRAYKHGWPRLAVHSLIAWKLRKSLFQIRVQNLDRLRLALDAEPGGTIFLANHSCWWDIFLAHALNEAIPVDGYGMMEHFNMLRFGFFRRIGAFSVDRTDPLAVRESIDYAVGLLQGPRAGLWIFPQGRMIGNDVRPLGFQGGLGALVGRARRVRLVAAALRYEFWQDERPEAFVRFGEPIWVDRADRATVVQDSERRLTDELDALKIDVLSQAADRFTTLFLGKTSISDAYARIHSRLFGPTHGAPSS